MKKLFLLSALSLAFTFVACDNDNEPDSGMPVFEDIYWKVPQDDGKSVYTFYRFANGTDRDIVFSILEPYLDVAAGHTCQPGEAFVYYFRGDRVKELEDAFGSMQIIYNAGVTGKRAKISFAPTAIHDSNPNPGDPAQWVEERTDERHIYRTYIFTEADYRFAEEHGIRY